MSPTREQSRFVDYGLDQLFWCRPPQRGQLWAWKIVFIVVAALTALVGVLAIFGSRFSP